MKTRLALALALKQLPRLSDGRAGTVAVRKDLPAARANPETRRARSVAPYLGLLLCALGFATEFAAQASSPPVITNVHAAQALGGSKFVAITYDIASTDSATNANISILVSLDSGVTWTVPASTFAGDYGKVAITTNLTTKFMSWNAGVDWDGHFTAHCRVRVLANDTSLLILIPPGSFAMGNSIGDADITDAPNHSVTVSSFYMDAKPVTGGQWNLVIGGWASGNGYTFDNPGSFKAANHPVQTVNWYDAVKWCNARSELEGLKPIYYTDPGFTSVYKFGDVDALYLRPTNGYRLPTEAEWEKAARGGAAGHRFPWSVDDNISLGVDSLGFAVTAEANYSEHRTYIFDYLAHAICGTCPFGWDLTNRDYSYCVDEKIASYNSVQGDYEPGILSASDPSGYFNNNSAGGYPYTTQVGSFAANGYGLYDMAGNIKEWCWDRYSPSYYANGQTDPQGPPSGTFRVLRGGSWAEGANFARCACRDYFPPTFITSYIGFRCVRSAQ